jgi:hypothetical protein
MVNKMKQRYWLCQDKQDLDDINLNVVNVQHDGPKAIFLRIAAMIP